MDKNKLPNFKIRDLEMNLIQGGMGVGISGKRLAGAVANAGGAGVIASVGLSLLKDSKGKEYVEANQDALREEIREARKISPNGVIGVNIMRALTDYKSLVETASEEDINLIISGAGLALDLPGLIKNKNIKLIPIVSNARVAETITKYWERKHHKTPDAFIVEGPLAGGHLGYKHEDLIKNNVEISLERIILPVIEFANRDGKNIPVIAAGGIYTGQDIKRYMKLGVAGVQMGTRFVPTAECDAADSFKRAYVEANEEDIRIIKSPVGMPGRAIMNSFLEKMINQEKERFGCNYQCLIPCKPKESPYCIAEKLKIARMGDVEKGLIFAGANVYQCTKETCMDADGKFIPVETLIKKLGQEFHSK